MREEGWENTVESSKMLEVVGIVIGVAVNGSRCVEG